MKIINKYRDIRYVHIAYHKQITKEHLYDIHKGAMRLFDKASNQRKDPMIETTNRLPREDQQENITCSRKNTNIVIANLCNSLLINIIFQTESFYLSVEMTFMDELCIDLDFFFNCFFFFFDV